VVDEVIELGCGVVTVFLPARLTIIASTSDLMFAKGKTFSTP
jgi:hypothetical protein